jgi:hypothetical protein
MKIARAKAVASKKEKHQGQNTNPGESATTPQQHTSAEYLDIFNPMPE